MACGENPKRVYGEQNRDPSTRMGNIRGQRTAFLEAQEYLEKWQKWAAAHPDEDPSDASSKKKKKKGDTSNDDQPPERDLGKETLALVLLGEVLPEIHCYTASDMLSMLQIADEFGFQVRSFHHALEAYKIRDILAAKNVAVSTWSDWWGFKLEAYDGIEENLALVTEAGGRAIVHSDSPVYMQRLNQDAAKGYYAGLRAGIELTEDQALRWITANPAWALGIDDQVGTLEVGKRADLVVWDGHPFRTYSHPRWVFVDGVLLYDRDRPQPPWSDFLAGQEIAP
jgi:imidazolonepropionase-like amidohydrolase